MANNAYRWGAVTFCVGITCGTLGHFLTIHEAAGFSVVLVAFFVSLIGASVIDTSSQP